MHDATTQAFVIRYPWWKKSTFFPKGYHKPFITIWHHDPEKDGSDDSCGWFMRARHGNPATLEAIVKRFGEDWDRVFASDHGGKVYHMGYFHPEDDGAGMPNMSVTAIVLNLFFVAACEHFKVTGTSNWNESRRWMQANLFDIMLFAENPVDSLRGEIVRHWGCDKKRDDRIRSVASCIYGWILRETRPWYKHPRWHIHHWRLQIHPWQSFKRRFIDRCSVCGKGFKRGEAAHSTWSGHQLWHDRCSPTLKP